MRSLLRAGAAAAAAEGLGLFALTVYFGVLFPGAGIKTPADFGDPSRYLPVVAAHPSWFHVPAWGLGLLLDAVFLVALVALRERLRRSSPGWGDVSVLFGVVGVVVYLVGHVVNVAWGPELIADYSRTGALTAATAAQYVVLSRIYNGTMLGGSFFTGLALVLLGVICWLERVPSRAFAALAIAAGAIEVAIVIELLPPALPLTGTVLLWLAVWLWRDASKEESR